MWGGGFPVNIDRMTSYGKAGGMTSLPPDNGRRGCYRKVMRYLVLIGLIVGGLLGYYVLWSHMADQIAAQAESWIEDQRRQGREVTYEARRVWGFPYRLSLTLRKVQWHDPRQALAPRLEADEITTHHQIWQREHVIFDLQGTQSAAWRDGGVERRISLSAERFRASLVVDGAGNWLRMAADLTKPRLQGPADGIARGDWTAGKLLLHARRAANVPPSLDLAIQADHVVMPLAKPFGAAMQSLRLSGNLRGGFQGRTLEERLASWRDAGGVFDFNTMAMTWGDLSFSGAGTLALDRDFRPLGAMSGKGAGVPQMIELLETEGLITPQSARAAKRSLDAAAEFVDNRGKPIRDMALTAQDGQLSYGPVPLLSLPSVLPGR